MSRTSTLARRGMSGRDGEVRTCVFLLFGCLDAESAESFHDARSEFRSSSDISQQRRIQVAVAKSWPNYCSSTSGVCLFRLTDLRGTVTSGGSFNLICHVNQNRLVTTSAQWLNMRASSLATQVYDSSIDSRSLLRSLPHPISYSH